MLVSDHTALISQLLISPVVKVVTGIWQCNRLKERPESTSFFVRKETTLQGNVAVAPR